MYRHILIPLDGSEDAGGVFPVVRDELEPDGHVKILRVNPPGKTRQLGGQFFPGTQQEEVERAKAEAHLKGVRDALGGDPERWDCATVISSSVSQGIADFARTAGVDLIAMYTHDRRGLSALIKRSVAKDVLKKANTEVKVFKPKELSRAS